MKRLLLFLMFVLPSIIVIGQINVTVTGNTNTTPNLATSYTSLANALTGLNAVTAMSGPVVFTLDPGNESAPPTGLTIGSATLNPVLSATNTVTIIRSSGTVNINAGIGTATPASVAPDGILKLLGADYITVSGLTFNDGNTTNPAIMEYGLALFKRTAGDGCNNNTISNCTFNMQRGNNVTGSSPMIEGTVCILVINSTAAAATTALIPTNGGTLNTNGTNSGNKFYSNTINGGNYGIGLSGYAATVGIGPTPTATTFLGDLGNDIGGSLSDYGNIIYNYGGAASAANPSAGIRANFQWSINISFNTINNNNGSGVNHVSTLRGIYAQAGTSANATINNNNITIKGGGTTSQVAAIENAIGATAAGNTVSINNNTVTGSYLTATTGIFYGIYSSSVIANLNIIGNNVSNISYSAITQTGTGAVYPIYTAGASTNVTAYNNTIKGIIRTGTTGGTTIGLFISAGTNQTVKKNTVSNISIDGTGTASTMYGIQTAGITIVCDSNVVDTLKVLKTTGTSVFYGIYNGGSATNENFNNNIVHDLTHNGTGTLYGIFTNTAAGTRNLSFNQVYNISGAGTPVAGIVQTTSSPNVFSNKIFNIQSTSASPLVSGIILTSVGAAGSASIYNNFISDIKAPFASGNDVVRGINITSTTALSTNRVYYNTIYLNGSSTGANFGNSGIFHTYNATPTTAVLDMRNNIIVNNSTPSGTGYCVAFRRSASTDLNNFSLTSNYNCFYTASGANSGIYADATAATIPNFKQTIGDYKAYMVTQDQASFSEMPPFVDITVVPNNLHLQTSVSTGCESGGIMITSPVISTDYDNDIRYGETNYSGTGSTTDVGADEFDGVPAYTCSTPNPDNTVSSANDICLGTTVNFSLLNATVGTGVTYQWKSSPDGNTFTDISGAILATYTDTPLSSTFYKCLVTCQNGPATSESNPVQIYFVNNITNTVPASRCGIGIVQLAATGSGTDIKWFTDASGDTLIGTGSLFTTPVIDTTTSYYASSTTIITENASVGAGATTSATYSNPFYSAYSNIHTQHLIKAAELSAAGILPGNLNSVALDVTLAGTLPMINLSVKIDTTSATALTAFVNNAGFTTIYTNASLMPVLGLNVLTFTAPFYWNGTSNIILEFCHGNGSSTSTMSRTVKADATSFVSSVKVHNTTTGGTAASVICSDVTTNLASYSLRPKFVFNAQIYCFSPLEEVVATVTPAPAFSITPDQTICNNAVGTLAVTSTLSNYDSYIWSPVNKLFIDAGCTIPYTGSSATTVYVKTDTAKIITYTCSANNAALCADIATTTITVLPVPKITSSPGSLCVSGSSIISASPAIGYGSSVFQWQNSPDNIIFNDISGANTINYTTPTINTTTFYKLQVKIGTLVCSENIDTVVVNNPPVLSTTPASRCGIGTVTLAATTTSGTINWYNSPSIATPIGHGTTFTTPVISSTTSYYAEARPGDTLIPGSVVMPAQTTTYTGMSRGYYITAPCDFIITSLYVPTPANGTTQNIAVLRFTGNIPPPIYTLTTNAFTTLFLTQGNTTTGVIPCNIPVFAGDVIGVLGDRGATDINSYAAIGSSISIGGQTVTLNRIGMQYNLSSTSPLDIWYNTDAGPSRIEFEFLIGSVCSSSRQEVLATVTPPPAFTISANQTICSNAVGTITVTSTLSNFDSYTWSPLTNLFTDASCTIPYTGSSATTLYTKSATASNITYSCTANNAALCTDIKNITITILPASPVITAIPSVICQSGNSILKVNPASGYGNAVFQWQDSPDGNTYTNIAGAVSLFDTTAVITAPAYYQLIIRDGSNNVCSTIQSYVLVNNQQITTNTPATRCGAGTAILAATGTGSEIYWFNAATGGSPIGNGSPFTTPVISTTTTFYASSANIYTDNVSVGAGASTSATYSNPFYSANSNNHTQHLITAAELTAAGIKTGNISSVALDVTVAGTLPMINLSVKIGATAASTMSAFVNNAGFSTVYSNASLMPVVGLNVLTFSTPFNWNGTSNIVLEFCHGNPASAASMTRTIKTDATSFVSTIKSHSTTALTSDSICGNDTLNKVTYSVRPKFVFFAQTNCYSPRVAVTATVTPSAEITITGNQTICNNSAGTITVTSALSNYDTYTWSPVTNLFTDASCTIPYSGSSETTVYIKTNSAGTLNYTCTGLNNSSLCGNIATTSIIVLPVPVITPAPSVLCQSGTSLISALPATGYSTATFQWQKSADSTGFTDISAANAINYTTPTITGTTFYRLQVKLGANVCSESNTSVVVNNPMVTGTTPATRCGTGTVNLSATGSAGTTLKWYTAATGGTSVATGANFTTPIISANTNYYASANFGNGGASGVGAPNRGNTSGYTLEAGLWFNVIAATAKINGVYIYPVGTGEGVVNIALKNSVGTVIQSIAFTTTGTVSPGIKTFVPLNWTINAGNDYLLDMTSRTGLVASLIRDGNADIVGGPIASNPAMTLPGILQITSGCLSGSGTSTSYYFFYDWQVETSCESARTQVTATVTPAPAITVTATPSAICAGQTSNLLVTSNSNPGYSYIWTPDAVTGSGYTVSPGSSTTYNVTAIDTSGGLNNGCFNTGTVNVIVNPLPAPVPVTPSTSDIFGYDIQALNTTVTNTPMSELFNASTSSFSIGSVTGTPTAVQNTTYFSEGNSSYLFNTASANADVNLAMTNAIDLTQISSPALTFSHICALEDNSIIYDIGYVQYSTDNGTTWTTFPSSSYAGSGSLVTATGTAGTPVSGVIFSTKSYPDWITQFTLPASTPGTGPATGLWKTETINIPSAALTSTQFKIRFRLVTDPNTFFYGWLIDNVRITGTPPTITWSPTSYLYTDAAATNAYTGGAATTVYAKPSVSTVYTATTTSGAGCTSTSNAAVNVTWPAPVSLYTIEIGSNSNGPYAKVGWSSLAPNFELQYGITPYPSSGIITKTGLTSNSITLESLLSGTTYRFQVKVIGTGGNSLSNWSTFGEFTTVTISIPGLWTGAISTDWSVPGNWSDLNVPTSIVNVVIPSAPVNQPHVTSALATPAVCNNLTINSGASLTIDAGKALTISGIVNNNAGATGLILKSVAGGTGSLIHNTAAVNATVERFIPHTIADEFHMLSSPVAAQAIAPDFNVQDGFYVWNETTGTWIEYADATNFAAVNGGTNFVPGKGYAVSYPVAVTKSFAGALNQGIVNIPLSFTAGTYEGWNYVANPYPSSVSWDLSNGWLRAELEDAGGSENAMWIWNAGYGNYGTYISNGGFGTGTNDVSSDIPLSQGFWVKATTSGTLGMNNDIRIHSSQAFLKSANSVSDMLRLSVTGTSNTYRDELIVKFGFTNDLNGAEKMFSIDPTAPGLYSSKLNKRWSINNLTSVVNNPVVPVGFKAGVNGNYTIKATELNSFATTSFIYLKDLTTNTITDLNQNANYTFAATTTDNPDRFQLLFALSPLEISNNVVQNTSIYSFDNKIYINSNETVKEIAIYNTLGQLIKIIENAKEKVIVNMKENASGYYYVKVITAKNVYSEKVLVK